MFQQQKETHSVPVQSDDPWDDKKEGPEENVDGHQQIHDQGPSGHGKTVEDIYCEITRMNDDRMENFREEVNDMEDAAADYFQDAEQSEKEFLRVFSMINMLAYDVYVRRMLIEKLVDRYFRDEDPGQVKNQRRKKKTGPAPDSER